MDPAELKLDGLVEAWIFPVPYPARAASSERSGSAAATSAVMSAGIGSVLAIHASLVQVCADVEPEACAILFGHGTLEGGAYSDYQTVPLADSPIPVDTFPVFDLAVWGHLHKRQPVASSWTGGASGLDFTHGYIGAPEAHDFGEEGQPKGVSVFAWEPEAPGHDIGAWRCRFVENTGARRFVTLDPAELRDCANDMRRELATGDQSWVYRVVAGTRDGITEAENDEIGALVRELKAAGVTIANACKVARPDRSRVEDVATELGFEGVLEAVFQARPDLAPDSDAIRADVRAWAGETGSAGKVSAA